MNILITYSSLTGNTKAVAEAIHEVVENAILMDMKDMPDYTLFDTIICGYWVDRGAPNKQAIDFISQIKNKNIIFFGTLGAWPDSEHAKDSMKKGEELANQEEKQNNICGSWLCQGKVDPKITEMMYKNKDAAAAHPMTEERRARLEEASKHPDSKDFANAQAFVMQTLKKI